jgi:uncharacterized membrane protein
MAIESEGAASMHPAAPHYLPSFITGQEEADWLLISMGVFLAVVVVGIGVFYLKLHALPEHMAHRGQKVQYEIVAVLALLALFTHNHAFWIIGLLLALIPIPDFSTPINQMAASLSRMSGLKEEEEKETQHGIPTHTDSGAAVPRTD